MMKWVLIVLGGILFLLIAAAVIGSMLPKGHLATRTVRLARTPVEVWDAITAFADQPSWRKGLKRVERLPDRGGHEVWNEVGADGPLPLETLEAVQAQRLVRRIADPKMPFGGTWTYELTPDGSGCRLTVTERGEVYNPIFRLVSKFLDMRRTIDGYLTALGTKLGEPVRLEE
jgi:uncharacterized protein YndB with AHSA1/START domain